jgi:hypothetical protein
MLQLLLLLLRALLTGLRLVVTSLSRISSFAISFTSSCAPTPTLASEIEIESFWSGFACSGPKGWRQHLLVVQPETVLRWHWKGWRLYWSWKSRTEPRPPATQRRGEGPDRLDLPREPALGYRAHSRRTAQAGDRRQQSLDPPISVAQADARRDPQMADLPLE